MTNLPGVLPELQERYNALETAAAARGLVFVPDLKTGGVRSATDTARYLAYREAEYALWRKRQMAAGRDPATLVSKYVWRPIAPFGGSYHNFGAAVDVDMVKGTLEQLGALAPSVGLRWGGGATFRAVNRLDPRHFELPITLLEAKARWLARGNAPGVVRIAAAGAALVVLLLIGGAVAYAHQVPPWRS